MEEQNARAGVAERLRSLTREQKLAVGVLGVACVVTLVFSVVRIRSAILRPFTTDVSTLVELKKKFGPTPDELVEQQKQTDTDGDGISDYDESTVHRTSPYLRDSDSDGDPDNIEIAKGTDPNCAAGKVCLASDTGTEAATGTSVGFEAPANGFSGFPGAGFGTTPNAVPTRDVKEIRAYLKASGMSEADIGSYTDAQILEAYDQSTATLAPERSTSTSQ